MFCSVNRARKAASGRCAYRAQSLLVRPGLALARVVALCVGLAFAVGMGVASSAVAYGPILAWGNNTYGQLGNGGTASSDVPVRVHLTLSPGITVKAVSAGETHSLALLSNGTVLAWGENVYGELGDGSTGGYSDVPVTVTGLAGNTVVEVAAGAEFSLARLSSGMVMAWGDNEDGELGDGTTTDSATPVQVKGLTGATHIAAGFDFGLAVLSDTMLEAWGSDAYGQLGNGAVGAGSTTPVLVCDFEYGRQQGPGCPADYPDLGGVEAIAAGGSHSLVLIPAGGNPIIYGFALAWGDNEAGELGDDSTTSHDVPVEWGDGLAEATQISAGAEDSFALLPGVIFATGSNADGELGDGGTSTADYPTAVSDLGGSSTGVAAISAGGNHTLALLSNGTIKAWGDNATGELGDGSTGGYSDVPITVSDASGVKAISAGGSHSLALAPLLVTTTSLPEGYLDRSYSQTLAATGGTPAYKWSITAGALPAGLTLNPTSGAITGTPSAVGTSTFTVTVTDSGSPSPETASASLSLVVLEEAEYGRCLKSQKVGRSYTGRYEDKNCTIENTSHEGKYEWYPGVTGPTPIRPGYTAKNKDYTVTTGEAESNEVVCRKGTGVGSITGPTTDLDTVTLTSCEIAHEPCESTGEPSGTMKTSTLDSELVTRPDDIAWSRYKGEPFIEFQCGPLQAVASGALAGIISPTDVMTKTFTVAFTESSGEQDLLVDTSLGGPFPSTVETTDTIKASEKWEVKT